jgi:membrane associated rhomboid family serine protease
MVLTMLDDRSYMRTDTRPRWSVTTILIITLVASYVVQVLLDRAYPFSFYRNCALSLEGLKEGKIWQLVTFQFMHSGVIHLLGNCIGVFFFGRAIEEALGPREMIRLYLLSGTFGGLLQVALEAIFPGMGSFVVGASAGVFGLIAAFATRAPDMPITILLFYFLPVSFPAKVFLIGSAVYAILGLLPIGFMQGMAHGAHLGGMLTGVLYIKWMNRPRPVAAFKPERRKPQLVGNAPKRAAWRKPRKKADDVPAGEFISREVDPILEKISAHGIHSLTDQERKILEAARDKMAKR